MLYVLLYISLGLLLPIALNSSSSFKYSKNNSGQQEYNLRWTYTLFFMFCLTVLVRGFAYDTGVDFMFYHEHFVNTHYGFYDKWGEHTEFGYRYLVGALSSITAFSSSFFILASALIIYSILKVSVLFGKAAFYSLLVWPIFMFTLSMNLYRQYIAISFILIAVYFLIKKRYFWNFLFSFLAVSFHFSAIIIIVFIWFISYFKKIYISKYIIIGFILLTNFAAHIVNEAIYTAVDTFQILFGMVNAHAYSSENISKSMYDSSFIRYVIMVTYIIWIWYGGVLSKRDISFRLFYYLSAISFILYPIFQQEILSRIHLYFVAFVPLFLGMLLYYYKKQKGPQIYFISMAISFHFVRYIYYLYLLGVEYPYKINIL